MGMGLKPSPNYTVRCMSIAEEVIKGKVIEDALNPFHVQKVKENMPGMKSYNPQLPWIYSVNKDGNFATSLVIYVDDYFVV